jgi:hypothetical protein
MALIEITSPVGAHAPGDKIHASPRLDPAGDPGWLAWQPGGERVWVRGSEARALAVEPAEDRVRTSLEAWIARDGRNLPDIAEAIYGPYSSRVAQQRNRDANKIRNAITRGSLSTALAERLAYAIGCSVEGLLFHGVGAGCENRVSPRP